MSLIKKSEKSSAPPLPMPDRPPSAMPLHWRSNCALVLKDLDLPHDKADRMTARAAHAIVAARA